MVFMALAFLNQEKCKQYPLFWMINYEGYHQKLPPSASTSFLKYNRRMRGRHSQGLLRRKLFDWKKYFWSRYWFYINSVYFKINSWLIIGGINWMKWWQFEKRLLSFEPPLEIDASSILGIWQISPLFYD